MVSHEKQIADLAITLYNGCLSHHASMAIARLPEAVVFAREAERRYPKTLGWVGNSQQSRTEYFVDHFLALGRENETIIALADRVWFSGSLITLGDALSDVDYLDRSPLLELIRHLRNGVAHGNTFEIRYPKELVERPAHNKGAPRGSRIVEITPELNGTNVLFDFMDAGDLLELLLAVHINVGATVPRKEWP